MLSYTQVPSSTTARRRESLPFTLRLVHDTRSLHRAVTLRHQAYERHVPEFAERLSKPEEADLRDDAIILLAESKLDGAPLSTMRIQTNALQPLALEASFPLPKAFEGLRLAEATRLGVAGTREGQMAKAAMFKAYYMICHQWQIDWMVITARKPLDRQYQAMGFADASADSGYVPMKHVGGLPHRVLALETSTVEQRWRQINAPLVQFFFDTDHPDILLAIPPLQGYPLRANMSAPTRIAT